MKTEDLIGALAADTLPRTSVRQRLARAVPAAVLLSLAAFLAVWGTRPDLAAVLASSTVVKTLAPLLLAGLAGALALGLSRPEARPTGRTLALGAFAAAILAAFVTALARAGDMGLVASLAKPSLAICLLSIPVLSLPILAGALWALSAGAPLRPGRAGAVAGLAAGGLSASIYSFYCDQDAALFFLPAYAVAILFVALIGSVAGARMLAW